MGKIITQFPIWVETAWQKQRILLLLFNLKNCCYMYVNPAAPSYSNVTSPSNTAPSMLAARCHTDSTLLANFFLSNPPPNSLFIPSMSIYFLFNSSLSNSAAILLSDLAKVVAGSPTPGPTCAGSGQLYGAGQMPHLIPPRPSRTTNPRSK